MLKNNYFSEVKLQNLGLWFLLFFLLNLSFFCIFSDVLAENGVYYKYFQSIISDGDFNIFNQFGKEADTWMATTFYNHPDYHSPFISSLLLAPYLFFKLFLPAGLINSNLLGFQLFFTLALGSVIVRQGYSFEEDDKKIKGIFYLLFFTNAALWQTMVEPSELSMICLIFSVVIFFELRKILTDNKHSALVLCLAVNIFSIIRADGVFYAAALILLFLSKRDLKRAMYLFLAFFIGIAQFSLVNYVRYGELAIHNPVVLKDYFYLVPYLFGPNGLFIKNPISSFLIIAMIYQLLFGKNTNDKQLMAVGLIVLSLKFVALSFDFSPVTNYLASRHMITEFPFMAYALYTIFKKHKRLLLFLMAPFILFNLYDLYSYFLNGRPDGYDYFFTKILPWTMAESSYHFLMGFLSWKYNFLREHLYEIGLLSFCSAVFLALVCFFQKLNAVFFRKSALIFFVCTTLVFSGLNFSLNHSNAQKMKQLGAFKKSVIVKGDASYYDEVLDIINLVEKASVFYGAPDKKDILLFQKKYIESVLNNVVYDPIGFSQDLKKGIIRKSFWQIEYP